MKIAFVTGIFPPDHGGPARYVPAMATALSARGHDVRVLTLSDDPSSPGEYPFKVERIVRSQPRLRRMLQTIRLIAQNARWADVVYLNGLVLEGVIASSYARTPAVTKIVGDLIWERATRAGATQLNIDRFQSERLPVRWQMLRSLQSWYVGRCAAVIVPSQYLARIVEGWRVPRSKINVVYNSVASNSEHAVSSPNYDVVTVARLVPWKGLRELIDVCAQSNRSLRIVGDGPLRASLEAQAVASGAQVSFAGHVSQERVSDEIRSGALFVLNSTYEGLPHIVLEAKSAGVPVLATNAGGTGETIEHGIDGWLVPPSDQESLRAAIELLLSDQNLRMKLAASARETLSTRFSFAAMVEATEDILRRTADTRSA